jgi:hypothetical protein
MEPLPLGAVGVLTIRAWREGSQQQLRMRVTESLDITGSKQTTHAVRDAEELHEFLRAWLDAYVGRSTLTTPHARTEDSSGH